MNIRIMIIIAGLILFVSGCHSKTTDNVVKNQILKVSVLKTGVIIIDKEKTTLAELDDKLKALKSNCSEIIN